MNRKIKRIPHPTGELTITSTEATYGGAIISYTLPNDDDILFVRADYTNGKGEDVFRVSSKHVNQIEISGFVLEEPCDISLTVVDENQNKSKAVEHEITSPCNRLFIWFKIILK